MDERDFELAERKASMEREAQIHRARTAVAGFGADECADCGEPIPADRRRAAPFAERCVECQTQKERR